MKIRIASRRYAVFVNPQGNSSPFTHLHIGCGEFKGQIVIVVVLEGTLERISTTVS